MFRSALASPEEYGALRRNLDPSPGLWIEAAARPAMSDSEAAQSAKLDLLASSEGVCDAIEDRLDEGLGFLPSEVRLLRQHVDQVGSRHGPGSSDSKTLATLPRASVTGIGVDVAPDDPPP